MNTATSARIAAQQGPFHCRESRHANPRAEIRKDADAMRRKSLLMTEALAAAHNAPDTRQARIEALRARIADGSYEIDAMSLAKALIRENPGLFRKY